MSDVDRFQKVKKKVTELRSAVDRLEGQKAAALDRLKEDFQCDSVEAAELVLTDLRSAALEAEEEFADALSAFQEKWKEVL